MTLKKPRNLFTHVLPNHYDTLCENDKIEYNHLRKQLSLPGCKNRRNGSNEAFLETLLAIKAYVVRNDGRDINRSLVCGITWFDDGGIAINTHQLSLLINKCKSSINGSFQSLQYGSNPTGADTSPEIVSKFPFLKGNFAELRQWTIRKPTARQTSTNQQNICQIIKKKIAGEEDITPPEDLTPMMEKETPICLSDLVRNIIREVKHNQTPASCQPEDDTDFFPNQLKFPDDLVDFMIV